ncbi:MAG TPA: cytochrome c3 family protein [Kofleriaceae bacterium]|nr:cytochrome c3 family protein [Kofleriaceae bacterium]
MRQLALVALVACGHPAAPRVAPAGGALVSNVLRGDYAGSQACGDCHNAIYQTWAASPMRNMTRDARTAAIRAPFDGATLRVGGDACTVEMQGGARFMRIASPSGDKRFRVTKVVGGRYREDFVGVDVTDAADPVGDPGQGPERVLPMTFVFSSKTWRYKGYSVMVPERPRMSWQGQWSQECIGCHNTLPLVTMLYDDLYGPSLPAYQGKMQDRILPRDKQWAARAIDGTGLAHAIDDEIALLGGAPPRDDSLRATLPAAAVAMEQKLDGGKLVELGIGCEACHNGARQHVAEPAVKPSFAVRSPLVGVAPPPGEAGTRAQWINHTCAKCHTVLFSRYPWTWEGKQRRDREPGGSSITSGEGRDYQLGHCASQMACTTCHDPHLEDPPDKLRALGTPAGNAICTSCHPKYKTDAAVAAHSHHAIGSAGSACIACHMAKKNMGLDYVLDRYHRIGSPDDPARVLGDRPLECALCHADKSVEALVTTMEQWYGKTFDRDQLRALYGPDLSVNAIRATLARGKPHEQAVAIVVLGERKDRADLPALVPMLWHEYPLVRYFAQRALQTITGDPVAIDVGASAADVRAAAEQWLKAATAGR